MIAMKKPRILVVENEKDVSDLMCLHLGREGHETIGVAHGEEALHLLENSSFDLAILDWMLPGVSGLEICKKLNCKLPVLMVTARADTVDIVLGLEMGADDYITKPFEIPVFIARVRALLRRRPSNQLLPERKFQVGQLNLDVDAHSVTCRGEELKLTLSEFRLLTALIEYRGRVIPRKTLVEMVQGQGIAVVDRTVDTHVFGLRKKLGPCAEVIETIRGVGYRVKANEQT